MKSGELSPKQFSSMVVELQQAVTQINVRQLSQSQAKATVKIVGELEGTLSALRSRCAAQVARCVEANQPSSPGAGARAVRTMFSETDMSRSEARAEVDKAEAVERFPHLESKLDDISRSNLTSIGRQTSKLGDDESQLLDVELIAKKAQTLPADSFDKFLKRHVQEKTSDPLADHKEMIASSRYSKWTDRYSEMRHHHLEIDPLRSEEISNLVELETSRLANAVKSSAESEPLTKDQNLAATALYNLICGHSSLNQVSRSNRRPSPKADLLVLVDLETLRSGQHEQTIAETESGLPVSTETIGRIACDSTIRRVETDNKGLVLNVGRKQRTATDAQWSAAKAMYSTCAWHGCEAPIQHCQLHHIKYWRHGGRTDMRNLVPLCNQHHHMAHEGGWGLELEADRSLRIFKPDRSLWKRTKPPNRIDTG